MDETMTLQGREITKDNIELVQRLIEANPSKESHLASHILGRVVRRISSDWIESTAIPFICFQTFVERQRFLGICYQAANWIYAGQTKGRSRNDCYATLKVPVKDIYLYPLTERFREALK